MSQYVLSKLKQVNAVITGSHIVYTSGKHGSAYVNKDAIYPYTNMTSQLCEMIAKRVHAQGITVDTVIAPAIGGVILSQWTAHHLHQLTQRTLSAYAEKEEGKDSFVIKRGYDKLVRGKNVLVVEDVLNTGGSVRKVVDAVRALGGNLVGVCALCNRGGVMPQDIGADGVPVFFSLVDVTLEAWDAADCPLCKNAVPINTDVGKGRDYLAKAQQ